MVDLGQARQLVEALVVGEDQHDVRPAGRLLIGLRACGRLARAGGLIPAARGIERRRHHDRNHRDNRNNLRALHGRAFLMWDGTTVRSAAAQSISGTTATSGGDYAGMGLPSARNGASGDAGPHTGYI
jgi:hypothetical protein